MRILAALLALALVAAACANDSSVEVGPENSEPTTTVPTQDADPTTTTPVAPVAPVTNSSPIVLCEEIETPVPSVTGTLPGGQNLDHELVGVVATYIAENSDTYAGRWIDRDYGGTFVIAFTDDPAPHLEELLSRRPQDSDIAVIEPRPPITGTWTVAESGYAIDVVQVEFTEAELRSLQTGLSSLFDREDLQVVGLGGGTKRNRIEIDMVRPTLGDLELLATLVPGDMVCVPGPLWDESMAPPSADEPLRVMADADDDPLVTCGSAPFRLSILDEPPDVSPDTDDPAEIVLLAGGSEGFPVPQTGWRTLSRTDDEAFFANFENDSLLLHSLRNTPTGWSLSGTSSGSGCILRLAVPEGVSIMRLGIDPENPVDPDSMTLRILVSEAGCSGGADPTARIRPPEVIETDSEIRIAVAVVPPDGPQTCPGNPSVPMTIELTGPIGDRAVLDGIRVPPEPLDNLDL